MTLKLLLPSSSNVIVNNISLHPHSLAKLLQTNQNDQNQLRCYRNDHSCYGLRRTLGSVTTKIYDSFLLKNVYRTEIDEVEPKLWGLLL